jgi:Protein tyrosine and serine/threonine kinase
MSTSAVPVRWSAPETLLDTIVTKASDCYSLGVTFHEVFSFSHALPYNNCKTNAAVIQYVGDGGRMSRPTTRYLPDSLWVVTQSLWTHSPPDRLSAKKTATTIREQSIPEASAIDSELQRGVVYVDNKTALYARLS